MLQDVSYESQLSSKCRTLAGHLGVDPSSIKVFHDAPFNYRNRMDFIFHKGGLGLRKRHDWKTIIDVEKCMISDEKLNMLLSEIREFFKSRRLFAESFDIKRKLGVFKYAVIRTPANISSVSFVINEDSGKNAEAINIVKEYAKISSADNVLITYVPKDSDISISSEYFAVKGGDMLIEEYLGKIFKYSVEGFFQNNTTMARKMHEYVKGLCTRHSDNQSCLLDLYAGVGTFGINNSDLFQQVFIVESDKNCIAAAIENVKDNAAKNCKVIELDAMQLKKVDISGSRGELVVITDPPRSGMHPKTIEQLKKLKPECIIYISCNTAQLGKDLHKFPDYELKSIAMFDLFPQTPHIEAVAELVRK
jgi:23S rRNA (uracil1939-C5)-methyltransferase